MSTEIARFPGRRVLPAGLDACAGDRDGSGAVAVCPEPGPNSPSRPKEKPEAARAKRRTAPVAARVAGLLRSHLARAAGGYCYFNQAKAAQELGVSRGQVNRSRHKVFALLGADGCRIWKGHTNCRQVDGALSANTKDVHLVGRPGTEEAGLRVFLQARVTAGGHFRYLVEIVPEPARVAAVRAGRRRRRPLYHAQPAAGVTAAPEPVAPETASVSAESPSVAPPSPSVPESDPSTTPAPASRPTAPVRSPEHSRAARPPAAATVTPYKESSTRSSLSLPSRANPPSTPSGQGKEALRLLAFFLARQLRADLAWDNCKVPLEIVWLAAFIRTALAQGYCRSQIAGALRKAVHLAHEAAVFGWTRTPQQLAAWLAWRQLDAKAAAQSQARGPAGRPARMRAFYAARATATTTTAAARFVDHAQSVHHHAQTPAAPVPPGRVPPDPHALREAIRQSLAQARGEPAKFAAP